jgi:hypothetical protein
MSSSTLAILMPGAMGAAMGARLTHAGCTVLTSLAGRSPSSADRARAAGMRDAPLADIVREADWILSVLPPSDALSLARELRGVLNSVAASRAGRRLVFVDANAIAPATMHEVRAAWAGAPGVVVLDGGIIGGPPSAPNKEGEAYNPTLYTVADADDTGVLAEFVELGNQHGLKIVPLEGEGAGVGDASALKMSYAVRHDPSRVRRLLTLHSCLQGIQKGLTGLLSTMILGEQLTSYHPRAIYPACARPCFYTLR